MNPDTLKYVAGICCTLLCNVLMVVGNYIMKGYDCSSSDVTLFKGIFQIPMFGGLILFYLLTSNKNSQDEEKEIDNGEAKNDSAKEITFLPSSHIDKAWTLAYGIFNGARFAAFYGAVLFMPMADYIVCIATTPIFSYIFSCLLIPWKTKFTILKTSLCIFVIVGVALVMQPPFIFGYENSILNQTKANSSTNFTNAGLMITDENLNNSTTVPPPTSEDDATKFTSLYWIGVALSFTFATTGAMCNVIPVKAERVSTHTLMFWAGLGNVIFSFLFMPLPGIELDTLFHPFKLEWFQWLIIIVLGFLAVAINQLLIIANILSSPTVNSMTRRSEIILVLFIDLLYFKKYPGAIKGVGYAIVLISVVGMALANDLQNWFDRKFKKRNSDQDDYTAVKT